MWESWGAAGLEGPDTRKPHPAKPKGRCRHESGVLDRGVRTFKLYMNVGRKGLGPAGQFSPVRSQFREQILCC